ncbi:MAG: PqqD family protein [Bacteroidales bacterium]|nr:PqqD family protein [Candidatus Physcocola equi]
MKFIKDLELRKLSDNTYTIEYVGSNDFDKIVTLNASAAYLFKSLINQDFSEISISNLLVDKYGIDKDAADIDAKSFIESWQKASLVEV